MPPIRCRFCGAALEQTFADLGNTPLANAYLPAEALGQPEAVYPLHALVCGGCFLVQIPEVASPVQLFSDYAYYSSFSSSWLEHSAQFAAEAMTRFELGPDSLVVEVASNDGYLLKYFQQGNVPVLGIEPARNIARDAIAAGIPTEAEFFGNAFAEELAARGHRPDLLIGNNVLAHVPDLNDFVAGLATVLAPSGVLVMEFPHLLNLIEQVQFDTIYHEHYSYLSLLAVEQVLLAHGLTVFDVQAIPTHGGSLRVFAEHVGGPIGNVSAGMVAVRLAEHDAGLHQLRTYAGFAETVKATKSELRSFLDEARDTSQSVVAYGAAAKGNTLLNTIGATTDLIEYVVDRSPHKQGLFLPGSHLPIHPPSRVSETKPDYLLILPWNLKEEIVNQMNHIRDWGGRFVVPIPHTEVLA